MGVRPVNIFHDLSFHTQQYKRYTESFGMDTELSDIEDDAERIKKEEQVIKALLFTAWLEGLLQLREIRK